MRATISNLTTTIFPHFDLLPLLALMLSALKVGVCVYVFMCLCMRLLSISQITLFHLLLPLPLPLLLSLLLLPLHFIISYKFLSCFYPRQHTNTPPPAVLPLCTNVIIRSYIRDENIVCALCTVPGDVYTQVRLLVNAVCFLHFSHFMRRYIFHAHNPHLMHLHIFASFTPKIVRTE